MRLALEAGTVVSVDELAGALWGDEIPPSAAKVVQGCVVRLRKLLGPEAIETATGGYRLCILRDQIDVHRFVRLAERARQAGAAGDPERAVHLVGDALALWREQAEIELDGAGVDPGEQQPLIELRLEAEELQLEQLLDAGRRADLAVRGQELVRNAPYRERRWCLLALAEYQDSRQADALATLQRARSVLVGDLGLDPGPELSDLEAAILRHDESLRARPDAVDVPDGATCPFRGLLPFEVADRALFFGRDGSVAVALQRLVTGTLSVVGASGCGKSSLVRAGVAAALQEDGRRVEVATPGPDPVDRIRRLVERSPRGTTIVLDQFEEVLTVAPPDVEAVAARLEAWVVHSPLVLTLRADRLAEVNEHPRLAAIVERNVLLLGPLGADDVRAAIEGPAAVAGLRLEPGLVEVLVRDVGREPGALPLLSHVLRSVWLHREGRTLTLAGYDEVGGLHGAIATTAEAVHAELDPVEAEAMRRLLLRLFDVTLMGEPVRRHLPIEVLDQGDHLRTVVDELTRARLVVVDQDGLTVAHEALASAWPRLTAWLAEDEDNARLRQHLAAAATAWEGMGRPDSELYRGPRLAAAQDWRRSHEDEPTAGEHAFLDASVAADDRQRHSLQAELIARAVANRRLRRSVAAGAVLLVIALVAGVAAVLQSRRAADARDQARDAATTAAQERLVASIGSVRDGRRDLAALLAVEAQRLAPGAEARSALFQTFTDEPEFLGAVPITALDPPTSSLVAALAVTERSYVVATEAGALLTLGTDGIAEAGASPATDGSPGTSWLAADGSRRRVAHLFQRDRADEAGVPTVLRVFELPAWRVLTTVELDDDPTSVALSPDGGHVAVAGGAEGALRVFDVATGRPTGSLDGPDPFPAPSDAEPAVPSGAVAFTRAGALLWADFAGGLRELSVPDLDQVADYPTADGVVPAARQLVVVDDQTVVGVGPTASDQGGGAAMAGWDLDRRTVRWSAPRPTACSSIAAAVGRGLVHCADRFGRIAPIDVRTGDAMGPPVEFQQGPVAAIASDLRGQELVAIGTTPVLARWSVSGGGLLRQPAAAALTPVEYDGSGRFLLTRDLAGPTEDRLPAVLDVVTGSVVDPLEGFRSGTWVGPGRLVTVGDDGRTAARDVAAGTTDRWGGVDGGSEILARPSIRFALDSSSDRLVVWSQETPSRQRIEVLDARTGQALDEGVPENFGAIPYSAEFSDDGRYLVTSSSAGLTVFDGPSGEVLARAGSDPAVVALGPDGLLAVGDRAGEVRLLDVLTLESRRAAVTAADGEIQDLDITADGRLLIARSGEAVRVFDVAAGIQLGGPIAVARPDPGDGASLSPDGSQLAVATEEGVSFWDLDVGHWTAAACRVAGRNLTVAEWGRYVGELAPYRRTCPQFPVDDA